MLRWLTLGALRALAVGFVFVVAVVVGFVVHLGVPAEQRAVVARVNGLLAPVFVGKLTIERVRTLGLARLGGIDARMEDPDGVVVIRATGIAGRVSTVELVRSLWAGALVVGIPEASLTSAEVNLDADREGNLRIANAFLPRTPSTTPSAPGEGVRLTMPHVHLGHVSVHGQPAGAPPLDADLDDADGTLSVTPDKIAIDVPHGRWIGRALPGVRDAQGEAEGHLSLPSPTGREFGLRVVTRAVVATMAVQADATYDGGHIDAVVDVPAATRDQVRTLVPQWPVGGPVAVHAEAHGELPRLAVRAHASLGAAAFDVEGTATVAPSLQASLHVEAKKLDARALAPASSPPSTDLALSGDVSITTKPSGAIVTQVALDVAAGKVGTTRLPAAVVTGEVTVGPAPGGSGGGSARAIAATAKVAIHEPGAPTVVTLRLAPKKGSFLLSFQAEVNAPDLAQLPLLGGAAKGRALAQGEGSIDLGAGVIDAQLSVAGEGLELAGVAAEAAHGEVHATGPLGSPSLDVQVAGEGLEVWRLHCSELHASASMGIDGGLTLRDLDLSTTAAEQSAAVRARYVRVAGGHVLVQDAAVKGFGSTIEGTLQFEPGRLYVQARSGELDLARIARFTGVSLVQEGRMSFDVDAAVGRDVPDRADGRVWLDMSHASFAGFADASAHVEAILHGRQASGHVTASVADIGSIDVQSSSVTVGKAGPLVASSWRHAWGAVDAKVHVDLPKLVAKLPAGAVPFRQVGGVLDFTGRVNVDSEADPTPEVNATVKTTGLLLTGGTGPSTWRIEGLDPMVHMTVDGDTGATAVEAGLHDATGPIAQIDATSKAVPYERIFNGDGVLDALRTMPFDARLSFPDRTLESLPAVLGLGDLRGELNANFEWHGAFAKPAIKATATLARETGDNAASSLPLDLSLTAQYDGARAEATLQGLNKEKIVFDATAHADAQASDLFAGFSGAAVPWTASAHAKLDAFSLRAFTFLSDRQVRGKVTGELTLERLHDDAHASATLTVDGLQVGEVTCRSAGMQATVDGHSFDAKASVAQSDGGTFEATAHAGAHWGRALLPALDSAQAGDVAVSARKFRAALLLPFIPRLFTQLDGRLEGDAKVDLEPGAAAARPQGALTLSDGTFELVSLGGEFADVSGKLKLSPDGVIQLEDFVAHALTGKVQAAATARLAGFAFAGAAATVQVPTVSPIPVVFDGVQLGMLNGHFDIGMQPAAGHKGLDVTVAVPNVTMELPTTGAHDVQALGDLEGVVTGMQLGSSGFVEIPLDATVVTDTGGPPPAPIKIAIHLGNEVQVTRGTDLSVRLQGEPVVTIAADVKVTGQIRLVRGSRLEVQGKPFQIDNGTVTFVGDDPSNPQVVLTAEWVAQDGTRVYADFVGPLKTGKVTLRSDPVLPGGQNDILALLLYGTVDRSTGSTPTSDTSPFAAVAGGVATQPINKALGGVNKALDKLGLAGGITTRIDTSTATPRPEVEVQIARDISVQVAFVIGQPPPGTNPDTALVTLAWRFLRRWGLETTVGDAGTSILDLIWQRRY